MIVYLCGPINGCTDAEAKDWREYAKANLNCETLDPMRRDYRGIEDQNVSAIVEGDVEDVRNSDVILVNAPQPSWGTAMEIRLAKAELDKSVVLVVPGGTRISPWLRYHTDAIYHNMREAIDHINGVQDAIDHMKAVVSPS